MVKLIAPQLTIIKKLFEEENSKHKWLNTDHIDEQMIYTIASLPGYSYVPKGNQQGILLGYNSLAVYDEIAYQFGVWFNGHYQDCFEKVIEEMMYCISTYKRSILVRVNCNAGDELMEDLKSTLVNEERKPLTYCIVESISENEVTIKTALDDLEHKVTLSTFKEMIQGQYKAWYDILYPKHACLLEWQVTNTLQRIQEKYLNGWQGYLGGIAALEYLNDLYKQESYKVNASTFEQGKELGGDFGKRWFVAYLKQIQPLITCDMTALIEKNEVIGVIWEEIIAHYMDKELVQARLTEVIAHEYECYKLLTSTVEGLRFRKEMGI